MPRFVILRHVDAAVHYDVMFERDGALKTFTVRDEPGGSEDIEAEQRFDHPLRFLDYEGDLRGAVGKVERWDRGEYDALDWRDELTRISHQDAPDGGQTPRMSAKGTVPSDARERGERTSRRGLSPKPGSEAACRPPYGGSVFHACGEKCGLIELDCRGQKWNCRVTLVRISPDKWLLKKNPR